MIPVFKEEEVEEEDGEGRIGGKPGAISLVGHTEELDGFVSYLQVFHRICSFLDLE